MTAVAGATLVSGYMASQSAKSAAGQYADAANAGIQQNQQMFQNISNMSQPYRGVGSQGLTAINQLMPGQYQKFDAQGNPVTDAEGNPVYAQGSGYFTAQPTMTDLASLMPNYEFGLRTGMGQLMNQTNAAGGAVSGNAMVAGQQYSQDYARNALGDAFNQYQTNRQNVAGNVFNAANIGQNAMNTAAAAGSGFASSNANLLSSIGNANASATMAGSNAYTSGISNLAMLYAMKNR